MSEPVRVIVLIGTRPEAIKLKPVVDALKADGSLCPVVVSTGQHRELLTDTLRALDLAVDHDLEVMSAAQTPADVAARVLAALPGLLRQVSPAAVLVQGDTTTAFAGAYASYLTKIPVGHVEAGLRTNDHENPFPEEGNRQLIGRIATWSFCPTARAAAAVALEHTQSRVTVTGNTAIDALLGQMRSLRITPTMEHLLVTLHRRESFGGPMHDLIEAIADFVDLTPTAKVLWPVHPNPAVRAAVYGRFASHPRVELIEPLAYPAFVRALAAARVILSDSGGVQEEAPSLGKQVLIARDSTERPEAVEAGINRIVGRSRRGVCDALREAWERQPAHVHLPAPSPYGDGEAAARIVTTLKQDLL